MTLPHDDATGSLFAQAEKLKQEARHEEALLILEGILSDDPKNVTALEEVADNEMSLERYDRALAAAKQVIALDPESCEGHYVLGFIASHEERWEAAVDSLRKANRIDPNNPEILRCLGWAIFSGGNPTEGVVTLERSLNLEELNPLTLCDLGVVSLQLKEFSKAKALFRRALELDPENVRVRECLEVAERIEQAGKAENRKD